MNFANIIFSLFCLFMSYQLYVFLRYILVVLTYKNSEVSKEQAVSVVICSHNELDNLQKHLPSILKQEHSQYEVIVVDDRSHDDTYDWLLSERSQHGNLKIVRLDEVPNHINNKKFALSMGIKAAQYPIVLLTDADCAVNSYKWIDRMSQSFDENTDIVLGVSLYQQEKGFLNLFIRFETYQTALLYLGRAIARKPYMGIGRNLAYRKALFIKNKGFNGYQSVTGGDDDLFVNKHANKRNVSVVIDKEAITFSIPKKTWASFFQQKKRHLAVGKHYKSKDKLFLGGLQLSNFLVWLSFIGCILVLPPVYQMITGSMMLIRFIGQYVVYNKVSIKFGDKFQPWLLPILELYYMFYYIIIGTLAIRSKRIQWK